MANLTKKQNANLGFGEKMPDRTIHCKVCNRPITGYDFAERMAKLRRHYKKYHPSRFKASIKRGVKARQRG